MTGGGEAWREQRDLAITRHAEALRAKKASETARARELIAEFVRAAVDQGIRPTRLVALAYDGHGRYRTGLRGWYAHPNRTIAVGTDGEYYLLGVPAEFRARLFGARPVPADPPLIVGEGGRDGERISLAELLQRRLSAGNTVP